MQPSEETKTQVLERLKQANNVLVTVSSNPSVDQLAAAIGLTLALNKMGKHATAVFSGQPPSTIEFLKPAETLEKNTDSLRDFIIALDKSKADKLRYKVEDKVVKIFITPYKTSISEKDLLFSQGDFNVDVVMALGIKGKNDVDGAIAAHGRILHDATVVSVNTAVGGDIGAINWVNPSASSLCEIIVSLIESLGPNILDTQMATAFLTGIVAETNRFLNSKATPATMAMSGRLMAAGASTQLIAAKLEPPKPPEPPKKEPPAAELPPTSSPPQPPKPKPVTEGGLDINHDEKPPAESAMPTTSQQNQDKNDEYEVAKIKIDTQGNLHDQVVDEEDNKEERSLPSLVTEPPTLGGTLTANAQPEGLSPSTDPLSALGHSNKILNRSDNSPNSLQTTAQPVANGEKTLTEIEETVESPHLAAQPAMSNLAENHDELASVDLARNAVHQAINTAPLENTRPKAVESLNANPIDLGKKDEPQTQTPGAPPPVPPPMMPPVL